MEILNKENFQRILAIVDADFERLECLPNVPNLILTDTHDLETMLIQSPALDKVLAEIGSEEKITKFGKDIRSVLLQAGKPIGYLRSCTILNGARSQLTLSVLFPSVLWLKLLKYIQVSADIAARYGFVIVLKPIPI